MSWITDIITVLAWPKRIPATKMSPVFSFTPKYLDSPTEYLVYFEVFSSYEINKKNLYRTKHYDKINILILQKLTLCWKKGQIFCFTEKSCWMLQEWFDFVCSYVLFTRIITIFHMHVMSISSYLLIYFQAF